MTMDAVRIETLPTSKSLLNASAPENTNISKEKDEAVFSVDDVSDDDEIQLRLSDDEDTEPDNASDHSKCPQTNIHPQNKDLKLSGSATPAKKSKSHFTKASPKQNSHKKEPALVIKEEISENNIVDEKSSDDFGSIDDQDPTMSGSEKPPYMQSSPKYWNNHFDKRWNGASSPRDRQNYPHRKSSDWYRQQFSDKNQFSHKNSHSNHNNQFSRLRSSSRGSYDQSRDKWRRDSDRESKNKFLRSRRSSEKTEVTSSKENGVCNDSSLVKHDTCVEKKESSVSVVSQNGEKVEEEKKSCDQKIERIKLSETKVFSGQESDSSSVKTSDKLGGNDLKPIDTSKNLVDVQDSSDNVMTQTKDCDEPLTENKKGECNSDTEKLEEKKSGDTQSAVEETTEEGKTKSPSPVEEEVCPSSKLIDETDSKASNATSEQENKDPKDNENLMEVDENNTNSCDSGFTNSTSNGKSSSSDNSKESDLEISDNNDKNAEENVDNKQVTQEKENKQDELGDSTPKDDDATFSEDTSQSSDEKSLAVDELEKNLESDELHSNSKVNVPDNEVSKDPDAETSKSPCLVVSETKDANSDDLKASTDLDSVDDSENSSKVDENDCDQSASLEDESENNVQESETISAEKKESDDDDSMKSAESDEHESMDNIVEEVDLLEDEMEVSEETPSIQPIPLKSADDESSDDSNNTKTVEGEDEEMNVDSEAVLHKKHRRRKPLDTDSSDTTNEEGARQKRLSAKDAEDRSTDDEGEENSENSETPNPVQANQENASIEELRSSPSVQKRALEDVDSSDTNANAKRIRMSSELPSLVPMTPQPTLVPMTPQPSLVPMTPQPSLVPMASQPYDKRDFTPMSKESSAKTSELVRKVSTEIGKLKKMTLEEIEALVLQKITESLTFRGENGKLREEVKSLKRSLEASRTKCQQLQKQVEGFDMVLKRITYDKNSNADKYLPPIKINRSVGLQVNFLSSEHGVQNLKQIQMRAAGSGSSPVKTVSPLQDSGNRPTAPSPRKQVKTRSPRRPETVGPVPIAPAPTSPVASMTPLANGQMVSQGSQMAGLTPMNKQTPEILRRPLTLPSTGSAIKDLLQQQPQQTLQQPLQHSLQQSLHQPMHHQPLQQTMMQSQQQHMQIQQSAQVQQQQQQHIPQAQQVQLQQPIVVASSLNNQPNRTSGIMNKSSGSTANTTSDLIDLTDEEERTKPSVVPMTSSPGYPRVIQTVPTSVPLSNGTNLRLVQTSVQSPPNAVVNSAGRILYTMPSNMNGQPRQIVLANSNTVRPMTSLTNKNISTMAYKQVVPTLQNGTVRVITASGSQNLIQPGRHPAPLPETPVLESNPKWKLTPPAPSLKISKVANGIVLSWNMILSDKFAEIVSYQLYAYQEIAGTAPNAAQWKKVGDVRALPLPMACTLTQFTEGNNYYFAVRAVDIHSRLGQYSKPGNISL